MLRLHTRMTAVFLMAVMIFVMVPMNVLAAEDTSSAGGVETSSEASVSANDLRNYAEIIDTFQLLKHASILYSSA